MSFGVGRRFNQYSGSIPPVNQGMPEIANRIISNTVARENENINNALKVDGSPLYIWTRQRAGNRCTCQGDYTKPFTNVGDPRDTGNNNTPIIENSDKFSFQRVNLRGNTQQFGKGDPSLRPQVTKTNQDRDEEADLQKNIDAIRDYSNLKLTPQEQALQVINIDSLFGGDDTQCAICFGTGFTDGYQLFGGKRVVLEASDPHTFSISAGELDVTQQPFAYKISYKADSYVSWQVNLPGYFHRIIAIRIWNNLVRVLDAQIKYQLPNTNTWTPLTGAFLSSRIGQNNNMQLAVFGNPGSNDGEILTFTHAEIIYEYREQLYGQIPPLQIDYNFSYSGTLITSTLNIGADIPNLTREAVVEDGRTGYMWQVITVTTKETAKNQLFGYDVSIGNIQADQDTFCLKIRDYAPSHKAYQGPEAVRTGDI